MKFIALAFLLATSSAIKINGDGDKESKLLPSNNSDPNFLAGKKNATATVAK